MLIAAVNPSPLAESEFATAARTGVETDFNISQIRTISTKDGGNQRVNRTGHGSSFV
jgi:hypothetical protein